MKAELPRKCKICGGPSHYGCGCEAKKAIEDLQHETNLLGQDLEDLAGPGPDEQPAEQPKKVSADHVSAEQAEKDEAENEILKKVFSAEAIEESDKVNRNMAEDIKTMADGFETLCTMMYDTNNCLKIIAGDLITIRKFLTKENEVNNAAENQD